MTPPDAPISEWLTGVVGRFSALDWVMRLLVTDFFVPVTICLMLLWLWYSRPSRERDTVQKGVMAAATSIGISTLVVHILNQFEFWPRPFEAYQSARLAAERIFYLPPDPAFPSNPATISFAAATAVLLFNRRWAAVMFLLATLWSFARLYAGIHYLIDVVGGAAFGALTALVVSRPFWRASDPILNFTLRVVRWLHMG